MKQNLRLMLPLLCWLLLVAQGFGAQLRGVVIDAETQLPLPSAHVRLPEFDQGSACDTQGRFLLHTPANGNCLLRVTHLGYVTLERELTLPADQQQELHLALTPATLLAPELVVVGNSESTAATQYSLSLFESAADRATPLALALERLPGVEVRRDARGRAVASLRGCRPDQVQVLLDGLPLSTAAGEAADLNQLPPGSVSRVEIQAGPGAAAGAGGVIRLYSSPTSARGELTLHSGSWNAHRAGLRLSTKVGSLQGALWLHHAQADNDFSYLAENGEQRQRLNNDTQREQALLKLDHTSPKGDLNLLLQADLLQTGSPSPLYLPPATEASQQRFLGRARVSWLDRAGRRQQFEYWRARHGLDNPALQWNPWTGSIVYHLPTRLREYQSGLRFASLLPAAGFRPQVQAQAEHQSFRSLDERADVDADLLDGKVLRDRVALELRQQVNANHGFSMTTGAGAALSRDRSVSHTRQDRGYSADLHLAWTGGQDGSYHLEGGVSRGFSLPDFNSRFLSESVLARGNPDLRPERSLMCEAAASVRPCFHRAKCEVGAKAYQRNSSDLVIWRSNYLGQYFPDNLARARVRGLELQVHVSRPLGQDWSVECTVSHSWQQALNTSPGSPYFGKRLPFAALWYEHAKLYLQSPGPALNVEWSAAGRRYTSESNLDPGSQSGGMAPYGVLDFTLRQEWNLTNRSYTLSLGVENLLDEQWELLAGMPQPGRSWNAGVSCSW